MRDKLKGLVVGLLIGSLVTGSMAYAANGKTINVILRDLKFKLDGTDKPSASSTGIVYDNTVYVPIRSVAGAIGKPVAFDNKTGTVSIGASSIAVYKGGTITLAELDAYEAASSFIFGPPAQADKELAVKNLIAIKLLSAKAEAAFGKEATSVAATEWKNMAQNLGSAEQMTAALKTAKLTESDIKLFIKQQFLTGKALESMIDRPMLQAEYDRQRQADSAAFVIADIRHILVATTDNDTGKAIRTEEEALARAKEAQGKLKAGGTFEALAKEYSDDPGSKETGGLYADAPLSQYVEAFKKAGAELPLNEISEPIKSEFGYHIMKVESRVVQTLEQVKSQLLPSLINQAFQNYFDKNLPALIQSIKLPTK
ncbi:peptidylprolyl isomerase [Cohnella lupini]|uniref:Foldase protein PrsA n=1 Tax=Cohnella lupini TaxID=1294267 RepID=A0A3D9I9Z5_9BACL|nr:peptidylprolyl isomerase [Cohnella lupini]RED58588.1 foldase protein PrsA [Cohnella lupini]